MNFEANLEDAPARPAYTANQQEAPGAVSSG